MRNVLLLVLSASVLASCGKSKGQAPDAGADTGSPAIDASALDAQAGGGDDASLGIEVTNLPPGCMATALTYALPANAGQYAAVRLTPPTLPFTVTHVKYTIAQNDMMCDTSVPHQAIVFTASSRTPPATPMVTTVDVPPPAMANVPGETREVVLALPTPLVVSAGDELFVGVKMAGTGHGVCVAECSDVTEADRSWWSNATMPPFSWATLTSFMNTGTLAIGVIGH